MSFDGDTARAVRWHIYPGAADLRERAAAAILRAGEQAIARRGAFRLVLAGGGTPRGIYARLREAGAAWDRWQVWFGDERCLPPRHPERNSRMAADAWLSHVPIPAEHIHPIPAELGPEAGAAAYSELLRGVEEFDLVLLGLGEDGHTASLFPGHDWGASAEAPAALAVHGASKPPPERVSLSAWRLSQARQVMFLAAGTEKREAVARWRAGAVLPAAAITPADGVDVLVDKAAFP
jgi:6-phosphogluconolactonase